MSRSSPLLTCVLVLFALAPPDRAEAQTRATTGRARAELAFDHGYGFGTEADHMHPRGDFVELATDFRLYAPFGLGLVLRAGVAARPLSYAFAGDLGVAQRLDLLRRDGWGLQLGFAAGASLAYGPFDQSYVGAAGGFAMVHLDLWMREMFFGIGLDAHALLPEGHASGEGRTDPILTIAPLLRVGADWGL